MSVKDKGIELRRPNFMAADTVYHFVVADETDVRRLALPCLASGTLPVGPSVCSR